VPAPPDDAQHLVSPAIARIAYERATPAGEMCWERVALFMAIAIGLRGAPQIAFRSGPSSICRLIYTIEIRCPRRGNIVGSGSSLPNVLCLHQRRNVARSALMRNASYPRQIRVAAVYFRWAGFDDIDFRRACCRNIADTDTPNHLPRNWGQGPPAPALYRSPCRTEDASRNPRSQDRTRHPGTASPAAKVPG